MPFYCIYDKRFVMIFSDLRVNRAKVLQQLADPRNTQEIVEQSVNEYLSLLYGLCEDVVPQKPAEGQPPSTEAKLRRIELFKWSNTICGNVST